MHGVELHYCSTEMPWIFSRRADFVAGECDWYALDSIAWLLSAQIKFEASSSQRITLIYAGIGVPFEHTETIHSFRTPMPVDLAWEEIENVKMFASITLQLFYSAKELFESIDLLILFRPFPGRGGEQKEV